MNLNSISKKCFDFADNGKIFSGFVDEYFYADETESIVIQTKKGDLIEFTENDIIDIKII